MGRLSRSFSSRRLPAKRPQHVLRRLYQLGAVTNELMAAAVAASQDRTGDSQDLAAALRRQARCNQGSGFDARLDDQNGGGKTGDDPVAAWKIPRKRLGRGQELADCTVVV